MSGMQIEGKGVRAFAMEIADGFKFINPLVLKNFEPETYKAIYQHLTKIQREIRSEPFPVHEVPKIRSRNIRLQRLNTAMMVLQHSAKSKKVSLF
jgi:hypothetical protein